MRESAKRILYHTVTSNAMNSYSSNTNIVTVTPPWETAVIAVDVVFGVLLGASVIWFVADNTVRFIKKRRAEG